MSDQERRYVTLLRVYPKRYRQERGDEIVATLMEASTSDSDRPAIRDIVDLTVHGTQMRLGLTGDRFAGRVFGRAATAGIIMGAALAVLMFIFNEWLPVVTHAPIALRFGPFWTVGPVVYLVWVLGAAGALLWPGRQRLLATVCVTATLAAIPVGDVFFARPNLWELMLLVGLGLPAVLAPSIGTGRGARAIAAGIGLMTLAIVGLWEASGGRPSGSRWWFPDGFWILWRLSQDMPYIAGAVIAVICILLVTRHIETAGALAVLLAPWLILSALYPIAYPYVRGSAANTIDVIAFALLAAWLMVQWMFDLRNVTTQQIGSSSGG